LGHRRFSTMPFSISLDLAAKGPHYEFVPIVALPTRVCDFGGLRAMRAGWLAAMRALCWLQYVAARDPRSCEEKSLLSREQPAWPLAGFWPSSWAGPKKAQHDHPRVQ
jgi:hypothetical protein